MIRAIRHTGLVVSDLDRALHFWCDVLGFKLTRRMDEAGSHIDAMMGLNDVRVITAKLTAPDGGMLELLKFDSHPSQPCWIGQPYSTGFTHIALTVDDLDAIMPQLTEVGVIFPDAPQVSPDGYTKVTYARGPEGILLELVQVIGN
jgi:catechol 2,3-dioxygenase-like lactoylglutathione lyase family enzyme